MCVGQWLTHCLQCFEFSAYLLINNNRNPSWICPHCNNTTHPDLLARDFFTEKHLERLPKNVSEIEFKEDHHHYKITKVDDPDSDNEDDDDDSNSNNGDSELNVVKKEGYVIPTLENTNVIDLISSDEEGEIDHQNQTKRPRES